MNLSAVDVNSSKSSAVTSMLIGLPVGGPPAGLCLRLFRRRECLLTASRIAVRGKDYGAFFRHVSQNSTKLTVTFPHMLGVECSYIELRIGCTFCNVGNNTDSTMRVFFCQLPFITRFLDLAELRESVTFTSAPTGNLITRV
jgi:hypothetical protein